MAENVIRFPGFLRRDGKTWKNGRCYSSFRAMVADLDERERFAALRWHEAVRVAVLTSRLNSTALAD